MRPQTVFATLMGVSAAFHAANPSDTWPSGGTLRVVAVDLDISERVPFGAPEAPHVGLADAVTASCALPVWYTPIRIDGHRRIDGGVWPETNQDLLVPEGRTRCSYWRQRPPGPATGRAAWQVSWNAAFGGPSVDAFSAP